MSFFMALTIYLVIGLVLGIIVGALQYADSVKLARRNTSQDLLYSLAVVVVTTVGWLPSICLLLHYLVDHHHPKNP
jgi:Na+-driven multidrug efflux pump